MRSEPLTAQLNKPQMYRNTTVHQADWFYILRYLTSKLFP
jgi:hypothetical protein